MPAAALIYATGKRKTAIARVWIGAGGGKFNVNGQSADEYFERETSRMIARQSLELLELVDKYDVRATVRGGGHSSQADALRHGIARALTRDSRKKERKKYGQAGARARFQYSKR